MSQKLVMNHKVEQLENSTERWCFFFKYAEETTKKDLKKTAAEAAIIMVAYDEFRWNEKDLITYEESILSVQKEAAILEQRLDDARDECIQIDKEKGGMKAKIAVAKNLLKAGISVELIAESTGLSQTEILQLKEKA